MTVSPFDDGVDPILAAMRRALARDDTAPAAPPRPGADPELLALLADWRRAEAAKGDASKRLAAAEEAMDAATPTPPELRFEPEDRKLFMRCERDGLYDRSFVENYRAAMARVRENADTPFSRARVARFDEIENALEQFAAARVCSRAVFRRDELEEEENSAFLEADALCRCVIATPATTLGALIAKLAATARVAGWAYLDAEVGEALASKHTCVEDAINSVMRDAARLAEAGELDGEAWS